MNSALDQIVRQRAGERCEYCLVPQAFSKLTFTIDHIIAKQHGGSQAPENLAVACGFCNAHKGPNIAGIDPGSGQMIRLFNPRKDRWLEHFELQGPILVGLTEIGRTTIVVLAINHPYQLAIRQVLIEEAVFPPA